jgi:predicted O-methyltransferase YrrM
MSESFPMKYGSHLPVLMKLMSITSGDILELGTGLYSTPYLHWACFPTKRKLVSYDNDPLYFSFSEQFKSDFHDVQLVKDWDEITQSAQKPWAFVLIDHAPSERRRVDAANLKDLAEYLIVHDTDPRQEKHYGYKSIWDQFKWRYTYKVTTCWTTVVSNKVDLKDFRV